jgi:hypothetical protein
MNKRLNDSRALAILMVLLMLVAVQCSSFVKTTYSFLGSSGVLYDTGMKTVADLYKQGIMSEEDKELAISIAQDYHDIYLSAVAALEIYQGMSAGDKEGQKMKIIEMMEKLSEIGGNLTDIINKYK